MNIMDEKENIRLMNLNSIEIKIGLVPHVLGQPFDQRLFIVLYIICPVTFISLNAETYLTA